MEVRNSYKILVETFERNEALERIILELILKA
jgi:hypothetical protein